MKKVVSSFVLLLVLGFAAKIVNFENNWGKYPLFNPVSETPNGLEVVFSMHRMVIEERIIDGTVMHAFGVPGIFLPNEEGAPNLFNTARFIAIPHGSKAIITILDSRTEVYNNVEVEPAPNVPFENDDSPIRYEKNMKIYNHDAYYPESPVRLSEPTQMRGVDVVLLGVMPFQYNPVTKDLIVYKDIRIKVEFIGGDRHFGEDRLRSRFWEPILQSHLLNYNSLPKIDFYSTKRIKGRYGVEYIIIVPDDPAFEAWGDTVKNWRKLQGISCDVFTLTEVGGSDSAAIKNFLQNAYDTWDPAPVAFLLLSDYPSSGRPYGITSPRIKRYIDTDRFVSDNWYADFNSDYLPELHHARICAQNETHLSIMVNKFLDHERNPPTASNFYDQPLVAVAWQTGSSPRWFQICGEVIRGFFINSLGKNPARQYAVYQGTPTPGCPWSTASGTETVVNYWNSVGYIQLTNPYDTTWWSNGSSSGIAAAINSGAFLVQHRDHGYGNGSGWAEPPFVLTDINLLNNTMFTQVYSSNCCTGMYDSYNEVFAEKFHRIEYGALGINSASEASYSYYNDTYVWGIYDGLWSQFDPGYPTFDIVGSSIHHPCLAMTYGKYYLAASNWVSYSGKPDTYGLFHEFGDCFTLLYSEVPQDLTVSHDPQLLAGVTTFEVAADDSSIIALTVDNEIIGVAEGTGSSLDIIIQPQIPGATMKVTVTKPNYYRYEADVPVVQSSYPYVMLATTILDDGGDGQANPGEFIDYGVYAWNVGVGTAQSVYGLLDISDPYITLIADSSWFGNIPEDDSLLSNPYYNFSIIDNCPDSHVISLNFEFYDINDTISTSSTDIIVLAPVITYQNETVLDGDGVLNPGETVDLAVTLMNQGSAQAENTTGTLITASSYITIHSDVSDFGTISPGDTANNISNPFTVEASSSTPPGEIIDFTMVVTAEGYVDTLYFSITVYETGVEESPNIIPVQTMLSKAYPNPFNRQIEIVYQLSEVKIVDLKIYDASGRLVKKLVNNQTQVPGYYNKTWDGKDDIGRSVTNGVYFVQFSAEDYQRIEKAILLR